MLLSDLLLEEAQSWWYPPDLRKQGKHEEAQNRERKSIASTLKNLKDAKKNGGWCSVGRGGCTLHTKPGVQVSSYGNMDSTYPQACLIMGIAVIDTTTITDSEISQSILFPMAAITPDDPPWRSCSYAPLNVVAALYAALGATLHNITPDWYAAQQVRNLPSAVHNFLRR